MQEMGLTQQLSPRNTKEHLLHLGTGCSEGEQAEHP